uniref:Variant surface glycoprotein 1125.3030 n=1 Tax=Trypanosoma brucei TaxID=5691 RepID=A0A1J0R9M7_9TRYP|nr:variant surface glycoprotein 1125.3030 [Trypanosoma brucei]
MLCLCANTGAGGGVEKVCCSTCQAAPNNWNTGADGKTIFEKLKAECDSLVNRQTTSADQVRSALATFKSHIAKPQGDGRDALFVLGHLEGNAGSGCLGVSNANGGICVIYAAAAAAGQKHASIAWHAKVTAALAALERIPEDNSEARQIVLKLVSLNKTAYTVAFTAHKQTPPPTKGQETKDLDKEDCSKHIRNSTCTNNGRKWTSEKEETGKYCKVDKPKVTTQAIAAGTGEGSKEGAKEGAAAEGKKCSDKKN